jgi:hypothetical protein
VSDAREPEASSDLPGSRAAAVDRLRVFAADEKLSDETRSNLNVVINWISHIEEVDSKPRPYAIQVAAFERIFNAVTLLGAEVLSLSPAESLKFHVELLRRGFPDRWLDELRESLQSVHIEGKTNRPNTTKPAVIERRVQYVEAIAWAVRSENISVDKSSEKFIDLCALVFDLAGIKAGARYAVESFSRTGKSAQFKRQRRPT